MVKFSVQMFKEIEQQVTDFITFNTIDTNINVKHTILSVIDRIHNTPKFFEDIKTEQDLLTKTLIVAKRYITAISDTDQTKQTPDECSKVIILNSSDGTCVNKSWNRFGFDGVHTKNLNIECLIIKSKEKIKSTHVHVLCKQLPRSTILNGSGIEDYHTSLLLTRILTLEDCHYHHFKPINDKFSKSDIRTTLTNLDFKVVNASNNVIEFKKALNNVDWKVSDQNTIEISSESYSAICENECENNIYVLDSIGNRFNLKLLRGDSESKDDAKLLLKSDTDFDDHELINTLYTDADEKFTMYLTYE